MGVHGPGGGAEFDGGLGDDHLEQPFGRLSVAETKPAAATQDTVAGQRVLDYENAAVASSPRNAARQPLGFKVVHSSLSASVQLTDLPNGSS